MKKLFYAIMVLASLTLASCDKDPIGGTATENMAGDWYCKAFYVTADGTVGGYYATDFHVLTYNTAKNSPNELFVDDLGNFWTFKVRVNADPNTLTFSNASGTKSEAYDGDNLYDITCNITNGKILKQVAKTPSGMPADSIVFDILFGDDDDAVANGGTEYERLRISGYRYTGLANDD